MVSTRSFFPSSSRLTEEPGEAPQGVTVGDAFAHFPVIPILYPPQYQGAQHLLRGQPSLPPRLGVAESTFQIRPHQLGQIRLLVEEVRNALQHRVETNSLLQELEVGEAELALSGSSHAGFTCAMRSARSAPVSTP